MRFWLPFGPSPNAAAPIIGPSLIVSVAGMTAVSLTSGADYGGSGPGTVGQPSEWASSLAWADLVNQNDSERRQTLKRPSW
jgi:hypothetical protein